ncbi:hypothetical protein JCM8097_006350 [Rhodosporidiobolus ruineniae]
MAAKPPPPRRAKQNTIPVTLVLEPAQEHLLVQYSSAVLSALQTLHPHIQLLVTAITPSSHAIPLNPFLPPEAFLAALPSFIRRPARPTSTIWRSTTGLLRAIKLARRRLLEGAMAGAGGEGRGQLPKYVVVISSTDVENVGGDEVWLEDDDQAETWESVSKNFTKAAAYSTTLFSLISLGHTPNLEAFWKESAGRFPANLVYSSTGPPPSSGFTFPCLSPAHACFLIGFHNNNARSSSSSSANAPSPAATNGNKRPAPSDPAAAAAANKKVKPNPPTMPGASVSPQLANAAFAGKGQPTPPNPSRTPAQIPAALQTSPQLAQKPSPAMPTLPNTLTNENLQQYLNDMKAAAQRNGQPPPSNADLQAAAIAAYTNGQQQQQRAASTAPGSTGPSSQTLPPRSTPTPRLGSASLPAQLAQMSAAQINALPQIPPDMRQKIEGHLAAIRARVDKGDLSQDEAQGQIKKLQDVANQARLQLAQKQQAAQAQAGHGQGLGLNIPLAPGMQPAQSQPPQPQQQQQQQQHQRQPSQQQQPQQPPAPTRQDSGTHRTIWRGPISFAFNNNQDGGAGQPTEFIMYCQAAPMQSSAVRDLADVKLPPSWRISALVPIKMPALQALAQQHTLPAVSITPLASEVLPKELKEKQMLASGHANEQLYAMLSTSMESRSNCGIVRFSGTPHGLVLVAVPGQSKMLALVFTKIPLPDAWIKTTDAAAHQRAASQQQQQQQQQQQDVPRPPSAQAQAPSGMFSSPVPFNLQLPPQAQAAAVASAAANSTPQPPAPTFTTPLPPQQGFMATPQPQQQQQFGLPLAPQQQQQQQAPNLNAALDFAELERMLGPEQFAAIMGTG